MAGERDAFSALTLLVAVCEQSILTLEALDPPTNRTLLEHTERVRDLAMIELQLRRFTEHPDRTERQA